MMPRLLCTCSVIIGKSAKTRRIAKNMGNALAYKQIEIAQEERYAYAGTLRTTGLREMPCRFRIFGVCFGAWYTGGGSLLNAAIIASSLVIDIADIGHGVCSRTLFFIVRLTRNGGFLNVSREV